MNLKKNVTTVLACTGLMFGAAQAVAQDDKPVGSGPNPYSDCGIGAALFPTTDWAAVTSNVIWDIGTTAMISATASPETCSGKDVEAAEFVHSTYENLIEETARGEHQGHVAALMEIYGCGTEVRGEIATSLRGAVAEQVATADYAQQTRVQKSEQYFLAASGIIKTQYAEQCTI